MEINMDLPATKEELINAGFEGNTTRELILKLNGYLIEYYESNFKVYRDYENPSLLCFNNTTKTELNKMLYPFIKRELDFTKKEKDYSLEECFEWYGWVVNNGKVTDEFVMTSCYEDSLVYATEAKAKQALALAKLSHIIAKIDKDYPGDNCTSFHVYCSYDSNKEICYDSMNRTHSCNFPVVVNSIEGAKILIKQHPELLKDALMVS